MSRSRKLSNSFARIQPGGCVQKNSFLAALDVTTGAVLWKTPRDEVPTWSSPTVWKVGDRFQILDSDPLMVVHDKFVGGVSEFLPAEGEMKAHILGTWLGYDFKDSSHLQPIRDDPEQIKNRASLYLAQLFTTLAEQSPIAVLLDDIHWADGGSLDTVLDLARRLPELPLLIVCSSRPSLFERRPNWGEGLPIHTRLDLTQN